MIDDYFIILRGGYAFHLTKDGKPFATIVIGVEAEHNGPISGGSPEMCDNARKLAEQAAESLGGEATLITAQEWKAEKLAKAAREEEVHAASLGLGGLLATTCGTCEEELDDCTCDDGDQFDEEV